MPVDDSARADPVGEQHSPAGNKSHRATFDVSHHRRVQTRYACSRVGGELTEVFLPARGYRIEAGLVVDLAATLGLSVEPGQELGHRGEILGDIRTAAHHCGQPELVGMASHHDHRLSRSPARGTEMRDAQIAARGQPAVERDLALTRPLSALHRGEVEEIRGDGLLEFVGAITHKQHQSGVRLGDLGTQRTA